MSYYIGVPLVFFAALSEASVLPLFRIAGLQPNLVLVLLVAWLMVRGANEAFVLIPIGGLVLGLVDGAPLGVTVIALAPIAFLHELRGTQLREVGIVLAIAFTVLMTLTYHTVYLTVFTIGGAAGSWPEAFVRVAVPACFLNVIILLPVYLTLWVTSHNLRRAAYV